MKKTRNFSLVVGGALLMALLATLAMIVLVAGRRIEQEARSVEADAVPGLIDGHTIRSAYSEGFVCALQLLGPAAPAERSALLERIHRLDDTARGACADYVQTIRINPREDEANFHAVLAARDAYLRERDEFAALVSMDRRDEAQRFLVRQLTPAYDALMRTCDVLIAYNNRTSTAFSRSVVVAVAQLRGIVITLVVLAVGGAALVGDNFRRRARIERELRESEEKFAVAFKLSPHSMTISRRSDGRIIAANDAFQRAYGQTERELIGKSSLEVGIWRAGEERERVMQLLARDGRVRDYVREKTWPDGRQSIALISVEPIVIAGEECMLAVAHDITARIEAERALERTVAEFRAIFDSAATGIVLVDRETRAVRWNRAWIRFLGYPESEMAGRAIADYTHPDDAAKDLDEFKKLSAGELDSYQIEKRFVRKDGAIVWGRLTTSVVRAEDGSFVYGVGLTEDITEHKRAELALRESETARGQLQEQLIVAQKLEALGQLAGGVAHDFNNMLTAIMLYLDLLKTEAAVSPTMRESLGELTTAAKRAAGLTRQLLLFSRREPVQRQVIDWNGLVENLLKMLGRLVGSHLELRHEPAPEPLWVHADPGMIEQVVMNLVVNARDAMPRGGAIVLRLEAVEFDDAAVARQPARQMGRCARLTVRDTGCGMSAATRARIFEPFFTTKAAGHGTGLGLSTVLGITQQHGGWVEVESVEGQGSTFAICLPAYAGDTGAAPNSVSRPPIPGRGHETVLVAEDNEQLRAVTARILRQHGYHVLEAADGVAAWSILDASTSPVDLLLTDVVMPGGVFGHELAAALRAQRRDTRVILMSAHNTQVDRAAIEAAGGVYLPKPFDTARLLRVVRATLDGDPGAAGA